MDRQSTPRTPETLPSDVWEAQPHHKGRHRHRNSTRSKSPHPRTARCLAHLCGTPAPNRRQPGGSRRSDDSAPDQPKARCRPRTRYPCPSSSISKLVTISAVSPNMIAAEQNLVCDRSIVNDGGVARRLGHKLHPVNPGDPCITHQGSSSARAREGARAEAPATAPSPPLPAVWPASSARVPLPPGG
jgi:hypothetical protein